MPQVICAIQADQPYWGRALARLGLAGTMRAAELSERRLTALLDLVAAPHVASRVADYASRFSGDGVSKAADEVESLLRQPFPAATLDHAGRLG